MRILLAQLPSALLPEPLNLSTHSLGVGEYRGPWEEEKEKGKNEEELIYKPKKKEAGGIYGG